MYPNYFLTSKKFSVYHNTELPYDSKHEFKCRVIAKSMNIGADMNAICNIIFISPPGDVQNEFQHQLTEKYKNVCGGQWLARVGGEGAAKRSRYHLECSVRISLIGEFFPINQ